ncbi:MAG: hypothetical protein EOO38_18485 [Cytophagaceae bacterium]|nr:MAG: hypothetical protein EOO38_18485 [Cytophagaceae bacterium]
MAISRVSAHSGVGNEKGSIRHRTAASLTHGNVVLRQDKFEGLDHLVAAYGLMNDAQYLLSKDKCSLSAAKLADAIEYLAVTISHRRAASSIEK